MNAQTAQRFKEETAAESNEQEQHRVFTAAFGEAIEIKAVAEGRTGLRVIHLGDDIFLRDCCVMRAVAHQTVKQLQCNQQNGADNGDDDKFLRGFFHE